MRMEKNKNMDEMIEGFRIGITYGIVGGVAVYGGSWLIWQIRRLFNKATET